MSGKPRVFQDDGIDHISSAMKKSQDNHQLLMGIQILTGTWMGEDDVQGETSGDENNLSLVNVIGTDGTETFRGVRKLAHVTGLNTGDPVLMVSGPQCPLTIIGELRGDIAILTQ